MGLLVLPIVVRKYMSGNNQVDKLTVVYYNISVDGGW